jgi:radical SAM-linked protein
MKLRLQITKDRSIRFISHLEYARTLMRAVLRAKLPVAYSEGFNPHMKLSLASALGVGVVSRCEFVEMELKEPVPPAEAALKLRKALPAGIRVVTADGVDDHAQALMSVAGGATYQVLVPATDPDKLSLAVSAFNQAEHLSFTKKAPKTRAGVKEIDVKFYIPHLEAEQQDGRLTLRFDCRITPAGSMKAVDLVRALNQHYDLNLPVELADIERLDLYRVNDLGQHQPMLDGAK